MEPRINPLESPVIMGMYKPISGAQKVLSEQGLPEALVELIRMRASQINGCGFCIDMHTQEATAAGESQRRINLVACWREATCFTDAERAALALTEEATRLADGAGVSDAVWDEVVAHYDENQAAALVGTIAIINAANRINVAIRFPGGNYKPGMFG